MADKLEKLISDSFILGLITTLVGIIIFKIVLNFYKIDDNIDQSSLLNWHNSYIFHLCLFMTGVLIHLVIEYIGFNDWYCKKRKNIS